MSTIAISSLYLPSAVIYQTHAAAAAAVPNLPAYDGTAPKYWAVPLDPSADPDAPFTIHNLHDANGTATWGVSFVTNGQAAVYNIPPDPTNPTNPPVYPASIPIPMTYPLPAGDSVIDTPFGLIISSSSATTAVAAPAPAGTDPTLVRVLAGVQELLKNANQPPV